MTNSRGQERPATYRKPEPPHTVNTDTGEVIDKHTGEVITRLPGHDAAKVPNGPIVSAPTWAAHRRGQAIIGINNRLRTYVGRTR